MQIISSFCQENELEGNWRTAEGNILTGGRTIGEKIVNQLSRVSHAAKLSRTGAISFFLQSNVCKTIRDVLASKWSKNAQYISWSHFNFYQGLLLFVVFYSLLVVVIYILLFTILSHCGKHASCNARHATQQQLLHLAVILRTNGFSHHFGHIACRALLVLWISIIDHVLSL